MQLIFPGMGIVRFGSVGKGNMLESPEIPGGKLPIEFFVEFLNIEGLAPGPMQAQEVLDIKAANKFTTGKIKKNFNVSPMGVDNIDILNQGHFFQHVFLKVALMKPTVDNRQGQQRAIFEQQHYGHGKQLVDFTGNLRQLGPAVLIFHQFYRKEEIAFHYGFVVSLPIDFIVVKQSLLAG